MLRRIFRKRSVLLALILLILIAGIYCFTLNSRPSTTSLVRSFSNQSDISEHELSVLKRMDEGNYIVVMLHHTYHDEDQYYVALYRKNILNFWPLIGCSNDSSTKGTLVEPSNGISGDQNTIQVLYYINSDHQSSVPVFIQRDNEEPTMMKELTLTDQYYLEILYLPSSEGVAYFE